MKAKITVVVTGYYEDRGKESGAIVFGNGETEQEMVLAMAESYYLDEDDEGKKVGFPEGAMTWEWLSEQIGNSVWWWVDEREIEVKVHD